MVCGRPLVGDDEYDGGMDAMALRDRGLFLCSNRVTLEHPFYNSDTGRKIWNGLDEEDRRGVDSVYLSSEGKVMVTASIDLPAKFDNFLTHEQSRAEKFEN